jgi:hypothetical protein
MVKDGVLVELPLYFSVFDSELIVVMVPLLFFSHCTSVKGRLEDTLHTKVTMLPVELSDAGIYTCFASNSDGTGESDMTTLIVSGKVFLIMLYFSVFDSVLIVVMVPLLFFSHSTSVKGRLEDTSHTKVTMLPVWT